MSEFKLSFQSKIIILTAVIASLLEIIDTSIVNVAVPTMMGNLGATLEDISWVLTGYIIANAIVLPIAGWLGMQIGRRKYYVTCILVFTAMSAACGLAPNLATLVVFRIFQGLAGGALLPTSQALIQEQFPREKAGMASAIYGMSVMIGPTLGPTLGGYLTDNLGWRSIFNINIPLGLAAAALAFFNVGDIPMGPAKAGQPHGARPGRTPIDFIGLTLLALGIGSMQYVLERGQADDWFDANSIRICTAVAVFAIPTFIWWELRAKFPVMNLRLFKENALRSGTLLMMMLGLMLYSLVFVIPVFVNNVLGYTATQTGLLFIPGALLTAMMMPIVGAQLRKRDPRILILIGVCVIETSLFLLTRLSSESGQWNLFWPLLVRGLGMAFLFVPINSVVLGQFSGVALGQVAGMLNLFRQVGGSMGIAALSTLMDRTSAQNYTNLISRVSWLNINGPQSIRQMMSAMSGKMSNLIGMGTFNQMTIKSLFFRVQKQAFVLSFTQLLWLLIAAFGLSLIPLKLLKVAKKVTGPINADH